MPELVSLEICAGAGGQALGLEQGGFDHATLVELNPYACATLRHNRPQWSVVEGDVTQFSAHGLRGIDLVAGGVPCPPFSKAGKQLGGDDERDLFPHALRLVDECRPRAVMLENVRGLLDVTFEDYRANIDEQLHKMGYVAGWQLFQASNFGVPQLRPRVVLVAVRRELSEHFEWPRPLPTLPPTVGEVLYPMMASRGWRGAEAWRDRANDIAPTLVGGSHKHGGPDLGPTRSKRAWEALGVNGRLVALEPPDPDFEGMPYLTVPMTALIQGFPPEWHFTGRKTNAYRQVGNAFPPPVARAVATQIHACLTSVRPLPVSGKIWHSKQTVETGSPRKKAQAVVQPSLFP